MSSSSLSKKNPAAFGGRASAKAAVATRAARSAGPTVRRAARMSRSKAIKAPKIQLPKSSSQGVIRSIRVPNPLRVWLNVSSWVGGTSPQPSSNYRRSAFFEADWDAWHPTSLSDPACRNQPHVAALQGQLVQLLLAGFSPGGVESALSTLLIPSDFRW